MYPNNPEQGQQPYQPAQPVPGALARSGEPISRQEAVRSIVSAILLTIVTCGIYGMYWQYMQFKTINAWLGREELNFVMYLVLFFLTCGLFGIYYEYKFATAMVEIQRQRGMPVKEDLPMMAVLLAIFQLAPVTWCIEQQEINRWYGASSDGV
jgi:magnesium-transporting ATPase (P-type)